MGEKGLMRRRERAVGASALFTILIFRKANLQYCTGSKCDLLARFSQRSCRDLENNSKAL